MDSGLRDARCGTILVVASRHCEERSSPGNNLTDKGTIILGSRRFFSSFAEIIKIQVIWIPSVDNNLENNGIEFHWWGGSN